MPEESRESSSAVAASGMACARCPAGARKPALSTSAEPVPNLSRGFRWPDPRPRPSSRSPAMPESFSRRMERCLVGLE